MVTTSSLATAASIASLVICCSHIAPSAEAFSSPSSTSNLFRPPPYSSSSRSSSVQPSKNNNKRISIFQSIIGTTNTQRRRQLHSSSEDASSSSDSTTTTATNGQDDLTKLKAENRLLQERLKLLQIQNDELLKQQQQGEKPIEQRLILEDFEGWPTDVARGSSTIVDGWNKREKRYTDELLTEGSAIDGSVGDSTTTTNDNGVEDDDELGLVSSGLDEDELCEYDDQSNKWTSGIGECPLEPNITFLDAMKSRAYWLVGLLALQSCSGFILSRNELLLQDHPVIIYFLTMLVGAGGNAGNQASVRVIRGLALGTLNPTTQSQFLSRELRMAFALSAILSIAGFTRAIIFQTPFPETMAVTIALSMIVFSSICLGAVLPLVLQKMGVDPAHSSTTIQVIMDILGVVLTVFVSTAVLDSVWGKTFVKTMGHMGL
ncbi:divalent cation transporter [Skeletonema marinoi]|uniref:Divalent cation transporter n=1 Tax=Skeletonema marinoi TaxID=267567 RepID=A0AAD8Y899_9STRA|nr:divalent cation transporter [Skeletonema marinoi]